MPAIDPNQAHTTGEVGDKNRVITLFLSLYLLVLAFFILLVTISTVEDVKTKAVMDSLTSTFASVLPPTSELTTFNSKMSEMLAAQEFQQEVTGLFASVVGVTKVEVVQPGRLMHIEMKGDALFENGVTTMREGRIEMLDRIVAALSGSPRGLRFEMEFVANSPYAVDESLPVGETLEIQRAGSFARTMLTRGIPPGAVTIGLQHGDPTSIEMWFHVRGIDENRIRFDDLKDQERP